jgi:hypothetical protein
MASHGILIPQSPTRQCRTIKNNVVSFVTCKNCGSHFSAINSPHCTASKRRAPSKALRLGNEADYCSIDCQSSHALKTMFVYQDLQQIKQMQDRGDGLGNEDGGDVDGRMMDPLTMSVDFKSAEEVEEATWNGIAHKLQDRCRVSPRSSASTSCEGGEQQMGNLFREYRKSNNFEDVKRTPLRVDMNFDNELRTSFGSFGSTDSESLDDNITEDYFPSE